MDTKKLIELGGVEWTKNNMHRIYFNEKTVLKLISTKPRIANFTRNSKLWFDVTDGEFYAKEYDTEIFEDFVQSVEGKLL